MQTLMISLPKPHTAQRSIRGSRARFNTLACGRRFGKTTMGIELLIKPALEAQPVAWFAPTYKDLADVWRDFKTTLNQVIKDKSETEKRLELITGGVLDCWSLDNEDSGRGRKYQRVVIDEAAKVKKLQYAWQEAIRPTLTDYIGDAFFLSTPKGLNFFKTMFDNGKDPHKPEWASWQFPTASNPYIRATEIEAARFDLPERVFRQEYLAEFIEDANLFRNVIQCATAPGQDKPIVGHRYVFGVDWAKLADFTVITVFDVTLGEVALIDRFNQIDYTVQAGRLKRLYKLFNPGMILAESNSIGEPMIDALRMDGLPIRGFYTSNLSKANIINQLSLAFEQQSIKIPNDPVLIAELQAYEASRLPGGALRYSAPEGQHDDTVISLALAVEIEQSFSSYQTSGNPFY